MSPIVSTTLVATLFILLRSVDLEEYDQVCMDYSRDCERRADLCYTKVELMHRSCPKTCNVCTAALAASAAAPPTSALALSRSLAAAPPKKEERERSSVSSSKSLRRPSKKCRDIASDCDETADLCQHASFKKMMKKQCAKTCGFCRSTSTKSGYGGGGDGLPAVSGLAGVGEAGDLPKRSSKTKSQAKEIDGLNISELVKLIRKAEETTETATCADMAYDCPIKQGLCGNARYSKLMLKMCMRTCNLCTSSTAT